MILKPYIYNLSIATIKKISPSVIDTVSVNGVHTANISSILSLSGNNYTWSFGDDNVGSKYFQINSMGISPVVNSKAIYKYDESTLLGDWTGANGDEAYLYDTGRLLLSAFDTSTGWPEGWNLITALTGMTLSGLVKRYMNGWKLTTADVDVANCVWTGIGSGATQSGASGYSFIGTNVDTLFTPYKMVYERAAPIVTQLNLSSNLSKTLKYVSLPYDKLFY